MVTKGNGIVTYDLTRGAGVGMVLTHTDDSS